MRHFMGQILLCLTSFFLIQQRKLKIAERIDALKELLPHSSEVMYLCMNHMSAVCMEFKFREGFL